MALGASPPCSPALVLRRCRAPQGVPASPDRGAAPAATTHRPGQPAQAEPQDRSPAGGRRAFDPRARKAATRLQGARDQVEGARCHHCDRHLAQHALHRHRADTTGARQADCPGSSRLPQGRPRRPDRFRGERLPPGTADPRQGGRAHVTRGSRHQHDPEGWNGHCLRHPHGDGRFRQGGGNEPRAGTDDRW